MITIFDRETLKDAVAGAAVFGGLVIAIGLFLVVLLTALSLIY